MKKRILVVLGALALAAAPVAAQDIDKFTNALDAFTANTPGSLPFAASAGIDWSNAYIGPLLGGDFPFIHAGAGGVIGFTTLPSDAIKPLIEAIGGSLPEGLDFVPLPFAVATARLGGLLLPFDVGLKYGFIPPALGNAVPGYSFKYQNVGLDLRLNLIKSDFLLPDISVGGGINMLNAGIEYQTDGPTTMVTDGSYYFDMSAPKLSIGLKALDIEAKAQVSKTFLFLLTPYAGIAASFGSASAHAGIDSVVTTDAPGSYGYWKDNYGVDLSSNGFSTDGQATPFAFKAYGGASLNIFVLKIDVQGMYNLTSGAVGGSVGARIQL